VELSVHGLELIEDPLGFLSERAGATFSGLDLLPEVREASGDFLALCDRCACRQNGNESRS
jgi:hypothetical protein